MIAFIIPTYDNEEGLWTLIGQVREYTKDYRLYVVYDNPAKSFEPEGENVTSIIHKENKGVAASWNDGIQAALDDGCTHFVLSNDDIELCEGWWNPFREAFEDGAHLVSLDQPCPVPIVTGWFFALDRKTLETVGLFDEQFEKFTSEDQDYAIRYKKSGLPYAKVKVPIIHHGSVTMNKIKKVDPQYYKDTWNANWNKLRAKYPDVRMPDQTI